MLQTGRPSRAIFLSESTGFSADSFNLTWKIESYAPIEEYKLMFRKLFVSKYVSLVNCIVCNAAFFLTYSSKV